MFRYLIILILVFALYPSYYFVLDDSHAKNEIKINEDIKYDVHGYIINLDRSKDRYQNILPLVENLGFPFTRISAVDGSSLTSSQKDEIVDFVSYSKYFDKDLKDGTIGCSLSHIKLWEDFLQSGSKYALVFEDDVIFDTIKVKKIVDDLIKIPEKWDIVSFEILHRGMPLVTNKIDDNNDLALYLFRISHSGAYLINRNAAKKYLEKAYPIKMPIDHFFTRNWEFDIKFRGVEPRIIFQRGEDSFIEISKITKNSKNSFENYISRIRYECQSAIARVYFSLKEYIKFKG